MTDHQWLERDLRKMEEYFVQKCVTADARPAAAEEVKMSTWTTAYRCECVMVYENVDAFGASRAVLASIVEMTTASKKTQRVVFVTLQGTGSVFPTCPKLERIDLSADWSCLDAHLDESPADSPLLTKLDERLERVLAEGPVSSSAESLFSARPNVVVLDSLNVLLEMYPLARVLTWLRQLRRDPRIGSVVFRINASALMTTNAATVVQLLAHETTAVVQVETASSLSAYPILAKQRRREIPKRVHGMVLLLRKKKNGRTSESVEFFHVANGRLTYTTDQDDTTASATTSRTSATPVKASVSKSDAIPPPAMTIGTGKALPVAANDVSFNLSISAEEEAAKRNVELPYMHQGGVSSDAVNNLLFIDEDDPDWDDDDLDDDLDI